MVAYSSKWLGIPVITRKRRVVTTSRQLPIITLDLRVLTQTLALAPAECQHHRRRLRFGHEKAPTVETVRAFNAHPCVRVAHSERASPEDSLTTSFACVPLPLPSRPSITINAISFIYCFLRKFAGLCRLFAPQRGAFLFIIANCGEIYNRKISYNAKKPSKAAGQAQYPPFSVQWH